LRIVELLASLLKEKPIEYAKFRDSFGNFEIDYPKKWAYDQDIIVIDGQYTDAFHFKDANFNIAIDARIRNNIDLDQCAKTEFESPSSGILAKAVKTEFRGLPAYKREYGYRSNGKDYFGGGILFVVDKIIFSISWNAPKSDEKKMKEIFEHMLQSLVTKKAYSVGG
jgi:hypothetical protein